MKSFLFAISLILFSIQAFAFGLADIVSLSSPREIGISVNPNRIVNDYVGSKILGNSNRRYSPNEYINDEYIHDEYVNDEYSNHYNNDDYNNRRNIQDEISPYSMIKGKGILYSVVDGDTVWVKVNKKTFDKFEYFADTYNQKKALRRYNHTVKMRIGGINTAESVSPIHAKNTTAGKKASNYLKEWAEQGGITHFQCYDIGYFGRPICAVNVNGYDIGYRMIKNGYSKYFTKYGKSPIYDYEYKRISQ